MAAAVLLFLLTAQAQANAANGQEEGFLAKQGLEGVDASYINLVIQNSLSEAFGENHGIQDERLSMINATLAPLFATLPKNRHGRLSTPSMRYAVQRYFSQRHGWVVKGFEPHLNHSDDSANGAAAHIMQSKIPGYIEGVLTKTLAKGGFALADVSVVVATIERLIFDDNINSLELAYSFNNLSTIVPLDAMGVMNTMISYFILVHLGGSGANKTQHLSDRKSIKSFYPHWKDTWNFMTDILSDDAYFRMLSLENPFRSEIAWSFEDASRIALTISDGFGPFSNHECQDMKTRIAKMDTYGTGRVKLSQFYATGQFLESPEYMESLGALDTSSAWHGPQVIISNYLVGINNCISTGVYFDVCCLNECDGIYQHLEARIRAPIASAAQIRQAIEDGITLTPHLSASAPTEARNLSSTLQERLAQIEEHHDGQIPLHSRLLAQWLHYAFPRECPFPHLKGSVERFYNVSLMSTMKVSKEVMVKHIKSEVGKRAVSPDAGAEMWMMDEELLDVNQLSSGSWGMAPLRNAVYVVMILCLSVVLVKELLRVWGLGLRAKKTDHVATAAPGSTEQSYFV